MNHKSLFVIFELLWEQNLIIMVNQARTKHSLRHIGVRRNKGLEWIKS